MVRVKARVAHGILAQRVENTRKLLYFFVIVRKTRINIIIGNIMYTLGGGFKISIYDQSQCYLY